MTTTTETPIESTLPFVPPPSLTLRFTVQLSGTQFTHLSELQIQILIENATKSLEETMARMTGITPTTHPPIVTYNTPKKDTHDG